MVEAQYGGRLMEEIAGDLIETSLREAMVREGLRPAAVRASSTQTLARNKALEYTRRVRSLSRDQKNSISPI